MQVKRAWFSPPPRMDDTAGGAGYQPVAVAASDHFETIEVDRGRRKTETRRGMSYMRRRAFTRHQPIPVITEDVRNQGALRPPAALTYLPGLNAGVSREKNEVVLDRYLYREQVDALCDWMTEYRALYGMPPGGTIMTAVGDVCVVRFKDEMMALAFRLRWAGTVPERHCT